MSSQRVVVGFMPLLDCAPLVAAVECGFAAQEGLDLRLVRETSWASIRDRLIVGQFNAAHMLGPMTVASALGVGHLQVPLIAPMALGHGGNAITVSRSLRQAMLEAGAGANLDARAQGLALSRVIRARSAAGKEPLVLAMVYPFSCHNYELRYWLSASGVDPDGDVRLVVIPPPLLVDALRGGQIDGFCVGEPWNSVAVAAGVGHIVTTGVAIWKQCPEKVLGLRREWAESNPDTVAALVRAIVRAAQWCDDTRNATDLAQLLAGPRYVGVPAELLRPALAGQLLPGSGEPTQDAPEFLVFARGCATYPWPAHAQWFYQQMLRWQQIAPSPSNLAAVAATYRPDLYRQAVRSMGTPVPAEEARVEQFFDGGVYNPLHEIGARG
jgi:two-component system, oxyanion-binding sensor